MNKSRKETDWDIIKNGMQTIHLLKVIDEPMCLYKTMNQILNETYTDFKK